MKIEKKFIDETTCVVKLSEEIEVYNSMELKNSLEEILKQGIYHLILDISDVEYIDSSGLGVLISLLKRLKTLDGKLVLLSPKKAIKQILELTSLDKIFLIKEDLESSINETKL